MTTAKQTVLIVDDAVINIEILDEILDDLCDVVFATDAVRGLELAVAAQPDLILLDVMMPGIDGYEMCRRLKADSRTQAIPVIFISARNGASEQTTGLELGAIDYIAKPIDATLARARVKRHLDLKREQDQLRAALPVDHLTGVASESAFVRQLDLEWRRAKRGNDSLAMLLIAADSNDPDNQQRLARLLTETLRRPADLVARHGNGRFACLLPSIDAIGMASLCRVIETAAAQGQPLAIRVATAVARPAVEGLLSPDAFLGRAERELDEQPR